ncbi:MAG: mechanosensitive ion channel [Bacteroidetes bacterium]|nr:mechanosensitive ion channel [Bacteroidota bacterium]
MKTIFEFEVLKLGEYSLTFSRIVYIIGLLLFLWVILKVIKKVLAKYTKFDEGQKFTAYTIVKYFLYVFAISAVLKFLGIDISVLVAGSAALFVGIGLGLQSLFYDFISGIILLVDGTIKVGNVLQIGDKRVEVLSIRFRTSVVKTREEKEVILPNSFLTKNEIINWSNQKNINRHYVELQVLEKDVERAMDLILTTIKVHPKVIATPEPYVRIERFTEYAVELRLLFWSEEVLAVGRMLGDIRLLILKELRKNSIVMPAPHQVVSINKL